MRDRHIRSACLYRRLGKAHKVVILVKTSAGNLIPVCNNIIREPRVRELGAFGNIVWFVEIDAGWAARDAVSTSEPSAVLRGDVRGNDADATGEKRQREDGDQRRMHSVRASVMEKSVDGTNAKGIHEDTKSTKAQDYRKRQEERDEVGNKACRAL